MGRHKAIVGRKEVHYHYSPKGFFISWEQYQYNNCRMSVTNKIAVFLFSGLACSGVAIGQTTFSWVNYVNATHTPAGATDYMYTLSGSSFTDNVTATITSSAGTSVLKESSLKYSTSTNPSSIGGCPGSGGNAPNGLFISVDWTNITSNVTITINFDRGTNGVCGPIGFSIFDINDDGFESWDDAVSISALNSVGAALNITATADCNAGASAFYTMYRK